MSRRLLVLRIAIDLSTVQHQYIANTALALGIVSCLPGINGLLRPESAMKSAMLPVPANETDRRLARSLTRMDSGRRLASGLTTIILWYHGAYRPMGWCFLTCGTLVAVVDGWAARQAGSAGKGWEHWVFMPASVAIGVLLSNIE